MGQFLTNCLVVEYCIKHIVNTFVVVVVVVTVIVVACRQTNKLTIFGIRTEIEKNSTSKQLQRAIERKLQHHIDGR
jgi:hypothetical protein